MYFCKKHFLKKKKFFFQGSLQQMNNHKCQLLFLTFENLCEEIDFSLKSVIVITVMISLHYEETKLTY